MLEVAGWNYFHVWYQNCSNQNIWFPCHCKLNDESSSVEIDDSLFNNLIFIDYIPICFLGGWLHQNDISKLKYRVTAYIFITSIRVMLTLSLQFDDQSIMSIIESDMTKKVSTKYRISYFVWAPEAQGWPAVHWYQGSIQHSCWVTMIYHSDS